MNLFINNNIKNTKKSKLLKINYQIFSLYRNKKRRERERDIN